MKYEDILKNKIISETVANVISSERFFAVVESSNGQLDDQFYGLLSNVLTHTLSPINVVLVSISLNGRHLNIYDTQPETKVNKIFKDKLNRFSQSIRFYDEPFLYNSHFPPRVSYSKFIRKKIDNVDWEFFLRDVRVIAAVVDICEQIISILKTIVKNYRLLWFQIIVKEYNHNYQVNNIDQLANYFVDRLICLVLSIANEEFSLSDAQSILSRAFFKQIIFNPQNVNEEGDYDRGYRTRYWLRDYQAKYLTSELSISQEDIIKIFRQDYPKESYTPSTIFSGVNWYEPQWELYFDQEKYPNDLLECEKIIWDPQKWDLYLYPLTEFGQNRFMIALRIPKENSDANHIPKVDFAKEILFTKGENDNYIIQQYNDCLTIISETLKLIAREYKSLIYDIQRGNVIDILFKNPLANLGLVIGELEGFMCHNNVRKSIKEENLVVIFKNFIENLRSVNLERQKHATKAAVAEVINRNYAHHIGAHVSPRATIDKVLHRLGKEINNLSDVKLSATVGQMLIALDKYKDERNEFIANLANNPIYIQHNLYRDVILPFIENTLLMDNIAANEGIDYKNINGSFNSESISGREVLIRGNTLNRLIIRVFIHNRLCNNLQNHNIPNTRRRGLSEIPNNYSELKVNYKKNNGGEPQVVYDSLNIPYYKEIENIGDSFYDERTLSYDDIQISLPGTLGKHAIYSILENYIRNTAKHNYDPIKHRNQTVEIIIKISPNTKDSYRLEITDNISKIKNEEIGDIKRIIKDTDIIEKKNLGIAELKINACLLTGEDLNEENMKKHLHVRKNKNRHLVYSFSILKHREIALIGENLKKLKNENKGSYHFNTLKEYLKLEIRNFRFAIIDTKTININELKENHSLLPFRLLFINSDSNQHNEFVKSKRAVYVNNNTFKTVNKNNILEECWNQWLKRFGINNIIDLRIFFQQPKNAPQTEKWGKASNQISSHSLSIYKNVCHLNDNGQIHPNEQLNDSEKFYILYDRHAKLSGKLKVNLLNKNFYEQIDKNSADFDLLFNANTDQNPFLFIYEIIEAGLMKVLILDERVAELSTELIKDRHYEEIIKNGFQKFDDTNYFTRFDACWAAGIYIGTHLSLSSGEDFFPVKEEINERTNHFLKIRFFINEYNKITIKAKTNFMEWDENNENIFENGKWLWKGKYTNIDEPQSQDHDEFKYDCLIIHRTILKKMQNYYRDNKGIDFLESLEVPKVIVMTGGGIVDFIDAKKWTIFPTNAIRDYVLGTRPAKLSLVKRISF